MPERIHKQADNPPQKNNYKKTEQRANIALVCQL